LAHSERVSFYAERLAERVGEANGTKNIIHRAGLLHDVGKLAIDPDILGKATKLTHDEMELIRLHPVLGSQMIDHVAFLAQEMEIILYHHERYDGKGYPAAKKGKEIPLGARIIGITEAWDNMISPQPYRATPLSLDARFRRCEMEPSLIRIWWSFLRR
jgi:HD-GYP domain-containing protein (c-di-GMP phosphodiesterase class II)